jgi:hypothetical protein
MGKDAQKAGADIFHGLSGELPLKWDKTPIKKIVTIHDLIFVRYPQYYSFFDRKYISGSLKKRLIWQIRLLLFQNRPKEILLNF